MPFDFLNQKIYTVCYKNILDTILCSEQHIFSNRDLEVKYLTEWVRILELYDKISVQEILNRQNIFKEDEEYFVQEIIFEQSIIKIHFKISTLIKLLDNYQKTKAYNVFEKISMTYFVKENSPFYWTPVNIDKNYVMIDKPIIACEYLTGNKRYLVIDGNKRLSYSMIYHKPFINAYLVNKKTIIDNSINPSLFDKLFYIMQNELSTLFIKKALYNISDEQLLSLSYLSQRKTFY